MRRPVTGPAAAVEPPEEDESSSALTPQAERASPATRMAEVKVSEVRKRTGDSFVGVGRAGRWRWPRWALARCVSASVGLVRWPVTVRRANSILFILLRRRRWLNGAGPPMMAAWTRRGDLGCG